MTLLGILLLSSQAPLSVSPRDTRAKDLSGRALSSSLGASRHEWGKGRRWRVAFGHDVDVIELAKVVF